jgi:hypothetical protein
LIREKISSHARHRETEQETPEASRCSAHVAQRTVFHTWQDIRALVLCPQQLRLNSDAAKSPTSIAQTEIGV